VAIAWKDQGTSAATATSGAALEPVTPGATDANDIGTALVWYRDTTTTPSTPSGWTLLTGPHTIVASRMWIYGRLMAASDDNVFVNFGTGGGTALRMAQIYTYSGYVSGTITDVVQGFIFEEAATAAINDVDITTSMNGALAANYIAIEDDLPAPSFSATNTGVSGGTWVENSAEVISALGSDGTIGMQTAALATAGTIGGGSFTRGAADNWGIVGFEIRPSPPAAGLAPPFDHPIRRIWHNLVR
jgi:hypothetical protein